uniref:Retrotransposon gag domain-containing protein n=1 Tax=Fagus sylvatica TaxID=28930 RepID=A0A2N9FM60_FAGSY
MAENDITMYEMFARMEGFMRDMSSRMKIFEEVYQRQQRAGEETNELKGKVDQRHATLVKSQEVDDFLLSMGRISSSPQVHLPPMFQIPESDKFKGYSDPKQHLRRYLNLAKMEGHKTDDCMRLKHEIQELINQDVIVMPPNEDEEDVITRGCA